MRIPPYIRNEQLRENMTHLPTRPFFVSPSNCYVIDGDTVAVSFPDPEGKGSRRAFSIRFNSIDAPEMPERGPNDKLLQSIGIDPHAGSPGLAATKVMRNLCRGRALLIEPAEQENGKFKDVYERLIANVYISGKEGELFHLEGSVSAAVSLYESGLPCLMEGKNLPPKTSDVVRSMLRSKERRMDDLSPGI